MLKEESKSAFDKSVKGERVVVFDSRVVELVTDTTEAGEVVVTPPGEPPLKNYSVKETLESMRTDGMMSSKDSPKKRKLV